MFTSIAAREPLSKKVAGSIEDVIRAGTIAPGQRLPSEQELCTQFGVSRTVVREALRMLSARGLLSIAKGKGVFVRAASAETVTDPLHLYLQRAGTKDYVLDVVHARQMIEPPIAAAAASHRTRDDLARLRKDIDDLRAARGEFRELARLDMAFHLDLARASRNAIMPLLLDPIHRLMPEIKSSVYATVADARASAVEWHERVLEKVIKRDAAGARAAMAGHLAIAEKHARRMLRKAAPVS